MSVIYPERPVRVVTSGAGGGADVVIRLIASTLAEDLGQPVTVDNQAAGITPIQSVAQALPDGHVLLCYSSSLWVTPLMRKMPYDAMRDFAPMAWLSKAPNIIVVHPALKVGSIAELLALARARPGMLRYGTSGAGGTAHLAGELLKATAGVEITHIPYKGNAAALKDLLAGQVQIMFSNVGSMMPHLKSGKVIGLAVTGAEPSALLPELPTAAASGLPGYEATSVIALFAPARTPPEVIGRLNTSVTSALAQREIRERFLNAGLEPVGGAPEELAATMKDEIERLGRLIKEARIRADSVQKGKGL